MARLSVIIPDDMRLKIEEIAIKEERNVSWIVRKSLEEYIKKCQNDTK